MLGNLMKYLIKNQTIILISTILVIVALIPIYTPSLVTAELNQEPTALRMALAPAANSHTIGNPLSDGPFKDQHNPSVFINKSDTYINKGETAVSIQIDTFNFYASKNGNPVTPVVVRIDGRDEFTILAIGATQTSYNIGNNSVPFDTLTPVITLNPGEKIATGFLDSDADGNGWGLSGNPIPAGGNGSYGNGAQDTILDQDEVWALSPNPLIDSSSGHVAGRDTPSVVEGQNIKTTNQGKALNEHQLLRSYSFSISFSSNDIFKGATLYTLADFGGSSVEFSDGHHDLADTSIGANTASSLVVEDGYVAYLCTGTTIRPLSCTMFPPGNHGTFDGALDNAAGLIQVDQNDPGRHGRWGDVVPMSQTAIATAQMPDGTVLFWQGGGNQSVFDKEILRIDPTTLQVTNSGQPGNHDTFCPGPALLPNGDLMLAGGGAGTEKASSVFEWGSETWERKEDMEGGHYYGTSVTLADGQVFHALGSAIADNNVTQQFENPEIWNGVSWSTLTGLNLSPLHANNGFYNSNYYPYLHLMPNSNLFHSGGVPTMHEINPNQQEIFSLGIRAGDDGYRHWGNSIMIDEGILFLSGGRSDIQESVNTTVLIDFNDELNITSEYAAPMTYDRAFHNMVQLPTGDVFVSGGNSNGRIFKDHGTVYATELWDGETDSWTEMADMTVPRNYHSTSFLLPDGRIWQAGGECNHCPSWDHHKNLQFYSPPYLFDENGDLADRPEITQAPTGENGIIASQTFSVTVEGSGATNITNFNIIKLSSTTHQMNTDVRRLSLDYTHMGNGTYEIQAHDNINVMTPGYWMLFAINDSGVPSEAAIVHVSTQPGTVNPVPKPKPVTIGNPSSLLHGSDGWNSNIVINESDTFTNDTGAELVLSLVDFSFYAAKTGGPVTPFVVKVNGDDDFTVKAIGTSRIPSETGPQKYPFSDTLSNITLAPNEAIAIGFLDALANGTSVGAETSIIARNTHGGTDEIYYAGSANGKIAELVVGQAPILHTTTSNVTPRDYSFAISIIEFDPSTPTPTPTFTPIATATPTSTAVPSSTPIATATGTVAPTETPSPTSAATDTPQPPASTPTPPIPTPSATPAAQSSIYLPIVTGP